MSPGGIASVFRSALRSPSASATYPAFNVNAHTMGQHEMLAWLHGRDCRVLYNDGMFALQDLETKTVYIVSMGQEKPEGVRLK